MKKAVKFFSVIIYLAVIGICIISGVYMMKLPNHYYITNGSSLKLPSYFNVEAVSKFKQAAFLPTEKSHSGQHSEMVTLKLFGVIPIKDVAVESVDSPVVIPGGSPFGIKLLTDGVMVIGLGDVHTSGETHTPAAEAGIKIGDVIVSIDGTEVTSNSEISKVISSCDGDYVKVHLIRDDKPLNVKLHPIFSDIDQCYKAGMWVRDSSAGIGTITFYDPISHKFGGLGHPVCDVDTGSILPLSSGEVVDVSISGVNKGISGTPGELLGSFSSITPMGRLDLNNESGLFGELFSFNNFNAPIPLGMRQEIKMGKATILTTVKGDSPKEYEISIEKIDLKDSGNSKNMVVKITDPELLEITGGIVQGMSGSPIIQNGKLVGAVTHVFVNDPTKGYGIFSDIMYNLATKDVADIAA